MSLMEDQGVEGTSVAQVVNAAQSSVGSFYARFEGKDDFVGYLEARVWADATQRWDQAVADIQGRRLTAQDLVLGVVRLLVDTRRADLERRRVLGTASGSSAHAEAFHDHVLSGILELLRPFEGEFTHPDPEKATRIGYAVVAAALDQLPTLRSAAAGSEALVDELARMFLAYLGSEATAGAVRRVGPTVPEGVTAGPAPSGPITSPLPARAEPPPVPAEVEDPPPPPMMPTPDPAVAVAHRPEPPLPLVARDEGISSAQSSGTETPETTEAGPSPDAAGRPVREEDEKERVDFFDVWS